MLTSVNDLVNYIRMVYAGHPDVFVEAVRMFYAYKCCLNFLKAVRIWEARHVYPDGNACHVSPWGAWHVFSGGGVPTFLTQNIAWFINSSINCFSSDPNSPKLCSAGGINTLLSCFLWWMSCKLWDRRWSKGSFSALPWNQVYYSPWIHERSQPCIELMILPYFSVLANGFSIFNVRLCSICI